MAAGLIHAPGLPYRVRVRDERSRHAGGAVIECVRAALLTPAAHPCWPAAADQAYLARCDALLGVPGGHVEPDDPSLRAALIREVHEETGAEPLGIVPRPAFPGWCSPRHGGPRARPRGGQAADRQAARVGGRGRGGNPEPAVRLPGRGGLHGAGGQYAAGRLVARRRDRPRDRGVGGRGRPARLGRPDVRMRVPGRSFGLARVSDPRRRSPVPPGRSSKPAGNRLRDRPTTPPPQRSVPGRGEPRRPGSRRSA